MKVALGAGASRQPRKNWGTSNNAMMVVFLGEIWYNIAFLKRKTEMTE